MAEKLPGEMTVPVSDSLRNNCMWSYRALWIGRRAEEETPVSSSLTCCSDPLGKKKKNEMMRLQHYPSTEEEPTLCASTRESLKFSGQKYSMKKAHVFLYIVLYIILIILFYIMLYLFICFFLSPKL